MGGCRCSYRSCKNNTKTTNKIHFFHYPVKQRERCKTWILRAEKPDFFDLDEYQLRNKVICEVHFKDDCFLNNQKKRLYPNAIPTLEGDTYCSIEENFPVPVAEKNTSTERFKQFSSKIDDIKILPVSEDGTLFILDTCPSYKVSKDVKTFVLNNDVLMPIEEQHNSNPNVKTERIEDLAQDHKSSILFDNRQAPVLQTKTSVTTLPEAQILNVGCEEPELKVKNSIFDSGAHSDSLKSQNIISNSNDITEEKLERMICKTVETKYLHKLDKHTKDLNQIKKALRISKVAGRLNKSSVLRFLKLRLPPSLFTLVTLSLDDDYNLTEEDETFFKNLHESSPVAYQFLMEDCNWRMPVIELHEDDHDSMDDT